MSDELDQLAINTIRTLSIDAVQQANSGHPGTPMALAPMVYTLWQQFEGKDGELVLPPGSHGSLQASEVRRAVRGREDEFGVNHRGSARNARQRLCQAR